MKVLLIEDSERVRRTVRGLLEADDIEVSELTDRHDLTGSAAAADAVVLDIVAAGSDDELTALEELAQEASPTPRVVFTAHAQPYLRGVAQALGVAAYLDRGADGDLLAQVVRRAAGPAGQR